MNKKLAALIEKAKSHVMTPEERLAQWRSFVIGEVGMGSDADERAYAAALSSGDANAIAACKAAEEKRMQQAAEWFDRKFPE